MTGSGNSHISVDVHEVVDGRAVASNRLRLLTILSAVFMPLMLIAGIYGMNFRFMPELSWHYGYGAVLLAMLSLAPGLLWYFYRKGRFRWFQLFTGGQCYWLSAPSRSVMGASVNK